MTLKDEGVVLAFDYGTRRIGVAIANTLTRVARPLATVPGDTAARWADIARLIAEWVPAQLVVGIPRHPDGAAHEMTARAEKFARRLEGRFRLPVARVDERYSTTAARDAHDVDAAAAAVILQQWLVSFSSPFKGEGGRGMGLPHEADPHPDGAARGQARVVSAAPSERSAKPRLHPLEGEGENGRACGANDHD